MTADAPAIEIRNLVRRFGRTDAIDGLGLTVQPGRCYGFFGRNGAGKTTTIGCLLKLLQPTNGEVRVFGRDPVRDEVAVKSSLCRGQGGSTQGLKPLRSVRILAKLLSFQAPRIPGLQNRYLSPKLGSSGRRPLRVSTILGRSDDGS